MAAAYRTSVVFGNAVSGTEPSGSINPAVGDLFFVFCQALGNTNQSPVCTDDNGGTYTLRQVVDSGFLLNALSIFVRDQKLINTSSTTVTVTIGAHTSVQCCVVAVSGMSLVGLSAIRQWDPTFDNPGTPTAAFGLAALTDNMTIGVVGYSGGGGVTPPTNWTERQDVSQGAGATLEVVTRDSGFIGTTITWGSNPGVSNADFILELDGWAASVAYQGDAFTAVASSSGKQSGLGTTRLVALAGSGVNPKPRFYMACFDTLSVRNYWSDDTPSLTNAPTPAGGATYLAYSLAQLSKG